MVSKQIYIRNQLIIRNRMIKLFAPKVYEALLSQIQAAVHAVQTRGIASAQGNIHGDVLNAEIGKVVTELYASAAQAAMKKYKPNIKAGFGQSDDFISEVMDYFKKYLLEKVVNPISRTTHNFIEKILQQAITNGWGVDKTVKELENTDILKNRARMIVRTETVRATNYTQMYAAENEDVEMEKQWIAIEDNRTRRSHSHDGVDGERVDLDQPFTNGLYFPGDPTGDAEEVINCRCTMAYMAKRTLNGNTIPKKDNALSLGNRINLNRAA